MNLLLGICAIGLMCASLVVAPMPPGYELSEDFGECQQRSDDLLEPTLDCLKAHFTEEQMNETRSMYNDTTCAQCKHFCRKLPQVMECVSGGIEVMKDVSNKSKYMVPFFGQLIETLIHGLCDNEDGMLPGASEDDRSCLRNTWKECASHLEFMRFMEAVAFCDPGNQETDPLTMDYVCQKISNFFECAEDGVKECSSGVILTLAGLKNKMKNSESCVKYN